MLTYSQVVQTADIIEENIEARQRMAYLDTDADIESRPQDFSRVYRLLVKKVLPGPSGQPPMVAFVDAVLAEHHNPSGMDPERLILTPGQEPRHQCSALCRDSVRLIPVGGERLLEKLLYWWFIVCSHTGRSVETMVVEQDAKVAQDHIRANDLHPLFVYDELQLIMADGMITETVHERGQDGSTSTWVLV